MKYLILTGLGTLVIAVIGLAFRSSAMERRTEDEELPAGPVPYWPAEQIEALSSMVTCTRCSLAPEGICTCATGCGHDACQFDQAVLTGLSRDELDMLDGKRGLSL